MLNFPWW